jgi:hypothetical protein
MDVELQSIEILTQKKVKLTIVTTHFCSYYTYFTSIRKFSSLNAVSYSPLKQQIAALIKNKFFASHVLDSVNVCKVPVKSLNIVSITQGVLERFYLLEVLKNNFILLKSSIVIG